MAEDVIETDCSSAVIESMGKVQKLRFPGWNRKNKFSTEEVRRLIRRRTKRTGHGDEERN